MNLKHFVLLLALFSVPEIKISAQVQQTSVGSPTRAESFARIREFVQTKKYSSAIALGNAVGFTEHPSATSIEEFEVVEALCEAYLRIGNLTQALPLFNEAYAYRLKSLGAKHSKTILSLTRLANVYLDHGDAAKALLLNQQALQLQEQEHPTEHQNVMVILSNLAMAYIQLGKCAIALPLNLKASNLRNSYDSSMNPLVSHEDQDYFQGENNLALNYQCLGNYEAALQLSRGGFRSSFVLGTDNPDYLRNQDLLASIDEALGNCDAAHYKNYFNLKTRKYIYGIEHPDTLGNISNLASNYLCLGDYAEALPLNQMALQLREEVRGPEHPETLQSLNNLAINYRALGEHAKALPLNQMALQLREKVRGPEHPETLQSLNNLASNYRDLGQYDTAISLALRAVHLGELILGSKHPDLGEYWRNLGFFLSEYKAVDPAILSFKTSVNIYQSIREQVSRIDRYSVARILFKDTYTPKIENTYQQLAILLTDAGRLAEAQSVLDMLAETEQFDFIRRSGDADPRHTRIDFSSFERAWFDRYQQISGRLATLGSEKRELEAQSKSDLSRQQTIRLKQLKADIAVAESAFNQFVNQIRANFAAQGPSRSTEVAETSLSANRELQTLVKELGKDVALLRYYVTNDKVGMLLTTPDIQIARNVNVDSKEINRLVATARRALRDPKSKPLEALQALYKVLFAPVEQDLAQAGICTIMLAPDGVLRYLPFGPLQEGKHYAA
ncbi:MAG: tetratricopeptide repeat protein [Gallionella sp.]|nr:tetratricopeptide repeat protein [Gallionella sp.]